MACRLRSPTSFTAPWPCRFFITGTFGAFIRMKGHAAHGVGVMFDIGCRRSMGWREIVAIPARWIVGTAAFRPSPPLDKSVSAAGLEFGSSTPLPRSHSFGAPVQIPSMVNVSLHPTAIAGWFGLLVTLTESAACRPTRWRATSFTPSFPVGHRTISTLFVISCILMLVVPLALRTQSPGGDGCYGPVLLVRTRLRSIRPP